MYAQKRSERKKGTAFLQDDCDETDFGISGSGSRNRYTGAGFL